MSTANSLFLLLALAAAQVQACIHTFGSRLEAAAIAGGNYTYSYNGQDWSNRFSACRGNRQSPLLLHTSGKAAADLPRASAKSTFSYGKLADAVVVNNGHTLQVTLPSWFWSDVKIPVVGDKNKALVTSVVSTKTAADTPTTYVKATPAQLHFHSHSEHVINGASYPLEMHIVHFIKPDQLPACPAPGGCPTVLGIMFALTEDESEVSPELRRLINTMPLAETKNATLPGELDLNALLPKDRTYLTYAGSLTTPPCTEGILWHVLATPMKISQSLLTRFEEAVGDYSCPDKKPSSSGGGSIVEEKAEAAAAEGAHFHVPPADAKGCIKLANGRNFRDIQPTNGRTVMIAE